MSATPPPGMGYFTGPTEAPGPGILLLSSALGLSSGTKATCDRLAELGYTVLAPDLLDGQVPETEEEAWEILATVDMNVTASLIQSSARLLQNVTADPSKPLGLVGYSSGASWALWLSARMPDMVSTVVTFYGSQSIDMVDAKSAYLCHFGTDDTVVSDFEVADLGLRFTQAGLDFRIEQHDGMAHGFAEEEFAAFDGQAEAVAWRQTIEFLAERLLPQG